MIRVGASGTRVTRRMVALFVVCALLPLAIALFVAYSQVHDALVAQRTSLLRDTAAAYGTALVDRLNAADAVARAGVLSADAGYFRAGVAIERGTVRKLFGTTARLPDLRQPAQMEARLAGGGSGLVVVRHDDSSAAVWLLRDHAGRRLMLELDPKYLWSTEDLPYLTDLCVLAADAAGPMACTRALPASTYTAARSRLAAGLRGELAWSAEGERYLSGFNEVFLRGRFGSGTWTIIATQSEEHALAPVKTVRGLVLPVVLLALLGAALIGIVQVRRALAPLGTLANAADRIGAGDFTTRLPAARDDEFGALAGTINTMSLHLGRQFASLTAHSEIDAAILSGVDMPRIVAIALRRVTEISPAERHFVLLADHETANAYMVHGAEGSSPHELPEDEIARVLAAPNGVSGLHGIAGRGVFALPIAADAKLAGALVLAYDSERQPAAEEIPLLRDLADRLAVALATARRDRELQRQAHFDSLTELPNRLLGMNEMTRAVAAAERSGRQLAVMFVDLDGFADVNDSAGHASGDQLLAQAAARLRRCVRKSDIVARLGGDEFAVVLPELNDAADAAKAARNLIETLSAPFQVGTRVFVSACVGIALYPSDGESAEELLRHADLAMYHAKSAGRGQFAFFEPVMNADIRRRIELERELRAALDEGQFVLHYQPQVDLKSARIVGVEALIRWMHPQRGLVPPLQFVAFAEASGMIEDLGRWALRAAVAQFVTWRAQGLELEHVSVNVSPRQFRNPNFTAMVSGALREYLMPASALRLEITESAIMDQTAAEANLAGLTELGVRLELDDFGTGYSSLAHLQRLPIATIKIDRAFIRNIATDPSAHAVVRATIDMAHALGKTVVAEGVEYAAQIALLRKMNCDVVQGYYVSAPLTVPALVELVHMRSPSNAVPD